MSFHSPRIVPRFASVVAALAVTLTALIAIPATASSPVGSSGELERWIVEFAEPRSELVEPRSELVEGESGSAVTADVRGQLSAPPVELASLPAGARVIRTLQDLPYALVETDAATAALLATDPDVASVRRSVEFTAYGTPNDPIFHEQWNLPATQVPRAWDTTTGSGVTVAVLDTGVARGLTDLAQTDIRQGIDLVDGDSDPEDLNGHGTHIIGTIAQSTDNGVGVAGVAHDATILPVRVLDARGVGDDVTIAAGVEYAVDNGADIINLSLGSTAGSVVLEQAIRQATSAGVIVVGAVGNEGSTSVGFPARMPEVIGVGAVGQTLALAPYSNTGPGVALVAPGGNLQVDSDADGYGDGILQQTIIPESPPRDCFCFYEGTSMAAPHVAAIAALLLADGVAPSRVRMLLEDSARDLGPAGKDDRYGYGLVQAVDALVLGSTSSTEPAPPSPAPQPPSEPVDPEPDPATLEEPIFAPGTSRDIEDACPADETADAGFSDVPDGSTHDRAIDCVVARRVAFGVGDRLFAPGAGVTRAQLASFLARLIEEQGGSLPSSPPDAFDDDETSVHRARIDQLAALGIVKGTTDRQFSPGAFVTRGQLASFIVATVRHLLDEVRAPVADNFDDDEGSVHESSIDIVAEHGITSGTGIRQFSPGRTLVRDQMASFLARTLDLVVERSR